MDNYTKFPNEILDAIVSGRFTRLQIVVILYVVRKVNGWNKPIDRVSVSQIARDSGYARRNVLRTVSDLEKMCVLFVERSGAGRVSEMRINDPEEWEKPVTPVSHVTPVSLGRTYHRGVTPVSQVPVSRVSQEPVTRASHTKEKKEIYKDTYQKKETPSPLSEEEDGEPWPDDFWDEP